MGANKIALIGATGLVGQEFLKIFPEEDAFKNHLLDCYALTGRPAQKVLPFKDLFAKFSEYKYFINAADSNQAQEIALGLGVGQFLVDNSSAFRMSKSVPLVVVEINGELLNAQSPIIANPNCTAAILCMALAPLRKWGLQRVLVSTYQAASGAGMKGSNELKNQIESWVNNPKQKLRAEIFPFPLFLNVMSHNSPIRPSGEGSGYNDEEWKVICESRKILGIPDLAISATCVRVPVLRSHTEAVTVDLESDFEISEVKEELKKFPGIFWQDDVENNHFPMPLDTEGKDAVYVGRLRQDAFLKKTLHFMLSGDQLRKGAALNAIQILKTLISKI